MEPFFGEDHFEWGQSPKKNGKMGATEELRNWSSPSRSSSERDFSMRRVGEMLRDFRFSNPKRDGDFLLDSNLEEELVAFFGHVSFLELVWGCP